MKFKCVVCGAGLEQLSTAPKLYCCDHCSYLQMHRHIHPKDWIEKEKNRRKQLFIENMSDEERERMYQRLNGRNKTKKRITIAQPYEKKPSMEAPMRKCHDCGRPTFNFRCEKCWLKIRGDEGLRMYGLETESEWDAF